VRAALFATTLLLACHAGTEPAAAGPPKAIPDDAPAVVPVDAPAPPAKAGAMKPALAPALEAELAAIQKDPGQSVGSGDKLWVPYLPNVAHALISADDVAITARLLAEVRGAKDRVYRLAILHVLGRRRDATVDAALIGLLDDAEVRPTAAYLLGATGFKGLPTRARDAAAIHAIEAALRPWLDEAAAFEDPFVRQRFRAGDFALAAFVRVAGPAHFKLDKNQADFIGYAVPSFDGATRGALLATARTIP
jgi:hypothetical protein